MNGEVRDVGNDGGKRGKMRFLPLIVIIASVVASGDAAKLRAQKPPDSFQSMPGIVSPADNNPIRPPQPAESNAASHPRWDRVIELPLPPDQAPSAIAVPTDKLPPPIESLLHAAGDNGRDRIDIHSELDKLLAGSAKKNRERDGLVYRNPRLRADGTIGSRIDILGETNDSPQIEIHGIFQSCSNRSQYPFETGEFLAKNPAPLLHARHESMRGLFDIFADYSVTILPGNQFRYGNDPNSRGDFCYQGGYLDNGYFVMQGFNRGYNNVAGIWDRNNPNANLIDQKIGLGPLELVFRYSYLSLLSGQGGPAPMIGARAGDEHDLTFGLNWFLNPQTVIKMNYVRTRINSVYPYASGDIQGLGVRLHLDY